MSYLAQSVSSTQDVCRKASSHSSFQHTHHLGHRVFRRYPYADMYVVYTDRSLHQLQLIHLKQPLYDVPDFCTAFPVQDFFSIFWYKYYVVCTIPLCMCRTFLLHFFVSCVLVRDALLPLLHFITGIISRKSGQKIQKIANLQYYKSKANYGTKKKGISR